MMIQDLRLFTSIRVSRGRCELLSLHLGRLKTSALALGYYLDELHIRRSLEEGASELAAQQTAKLSVSLSADGSWTVDAAPLTLPDAFALQAVLWPDLVSSRDPLLHHRTTPWPVYDAALREAQSRVYCDSIFYNEQAISLRAQITM